MHKRLRSRQAKKPTQVPLGSEGKSWDPNLGGGSEGSALLLIVLNPSFHFPVGACLGWCGNQFCKTLKRKRERQREVGCKAKGSQQASVIGFPVMDCQDIIIYSCPTEGAFCILSLCFFKPLYYNQSCFSGVLFNVQEKVLILDRYFQNAFLSI